MNYLEAFGPLRSIFAQGLPPRARWLRILTILGQIEGESEAKQVVVNYLLDRPDLPLLRWADASWVRPMEHVRLWEKHGGTWLWPEKTVFEPLINTLEVTGYDLGQVLQWDASLAKAFLDWVNLKSFEHLSLHQLTLTPKTFELFQERYTWKQLKGLRLDNVFCENTLGQNHIRAPAELWLRSCAQLEQLFWSGCSGTEIIKGLLTLKASHPRRWRQPQAILPKLVALELPYVCLKAQDIKMLMQWPQTPQLRTLNLEGNHLLGQEGLECLAHAPELSQLERLRLDALDEASWQIIAQSPFFSESVLQRRL